MLRCSIRDLLWLTVFVAVAAAWCIDQAATKASAEARESRWRRYSCDLAVQLANTKGEILTTSMPDGGTWTILPDERATVDQQ
jgi:hypothetical protein